MLKQIYFKNENPELSCGVNANYPEGIYNLLLRELPAGDFLELFRLMRQRIDAASQDRFTIQPLSEQENCANLIKKEAQHIGCKS